MQLKKSGATTQTYLTSLELPSQLEHLLLTAVAVTSFCLSVELLEESKQLWKSDHVLGYIPKTMTISKGTRTSVKVRQI